VQVTDRRHTAQTLRRVARMSGAGLAQSGSIAVAVVVHRRTLRRMYYQIIQQMKKQLIQLDKWLEAAAAHAQTKGFDPNVFLGLRLAVDQFAFARQVQTACDTAKLAAARLSGQEAPVQADTEKTLEELRVRVTSVIKYLDGFSANDFQAAATRVITQPRWEGKVMTGADYFLEHALPNFFFHLTHAYAILRHNGVPMGKRDYLGTLSLRSA
jgi:hypothetical protein